MNSAEVLIKFKGDTTDADKATKEVSNSLGGLTKAFTLGNLAAKGISKAIGIFNEGLDSSINRIDTMNNFTTVMENLGIASQDSADVISSLSEELVGLPTTLNSAASSVQRLTSYNGDIKKSEQYFLAMNNAIIAGTNDAGMQASAIEQLTQAYTKGKPDMQDWKTLLQAMPAQLKQVAVAMGYPQTDQLYEALKNGEVSMNDFMDTLVELNNTGVDGFATLEEQARANTAGIGTSITNMKTAFVRGIGGIITSVDSSLEPVGGLSGVIATLGKVGEQAFKGIGEVLGTLLPPLIEIGQEVFPEIAKSLKPLLPALKDLAKSLFPAIAKVLKKILPSVSKLIEKIMPLAVKIIESLIPLLDPLADFLAAYIDYFVALMEPLLDILNVILPPIIDILSGLIQTILPVMTTILKGLTGVINGLVGVVKGAINFIVTIPQTIGNIVSAIIDFVVGLPGEIASIIGLIGNELVKFVTQTIPSFISNIINFFKELPGKIFNIVVSIPGKIKNAFENGIDKVLEGAKSIFNTIWDTVKGLPEKFIKLGEDIVKGVWKGIKGLKNWLWDKTTGFFGGIVDGIKGFLGIHSPSVVMEKEVGVNLGLGVIKGLDDTQNQLNSAVKDISTGISANIGGGFSNMSTMQSSNIKPIVNVYADFKTDPLGQTVSNIKTFSGGAKNDYNYGVGV